MSHGNFEPKQADVSKSVFRNNEIIISLRCLFKRGCYKPPPDGNCVVSSVINCQLFARCSIYMIDGETSSAVYAIFYQWKIMDRIFMRV